MSFRPVEQVLTKEQYRGLVNLLKRNSGGKCVINAKPPFTVQVIPWHATLLKAIKVKILSLFI